MEVAEEEQDNVNCIGQRIQQPLTYLGKHRGIDQTERGSAEQAERAGGTLTEFVV